IESAVSGGGWRRALGSAGVLAVVSPAGDTTGLVDMELSQRALRDVHGRLDELTTLVTERLTTTARRAGQLEVPAIRAIVTQAVDELRQHPLPTADNTAAKDSNDALEQALADAERHPTAASTAADSARCPRPRRRAFPSPLHRQQTVGKRGVGPAGKPRTRH
ncbi:hypothetical protein, partial [Streptomyces sp. NPDC058394]|uniref:hypothetical protein n=1 Tax=Streptomyces sp. NPDC058394 TaxID=3346477 RepID=UPI00365FE661